MPLSTATQKQPLVQHIQWDGTNLAEIQALLDGPAPFGWTVTASGSTLDLSGGAAGNQQLPVGTHLVGRPYWGTTPPAFSLSEVLSDADFLAKYGA